MHLRYGESAGGALRAHKFRTSAFDSIQCSVDIVCAIDSHVNAGELVDVAQL